MSKKTTIGGKIFLVGVALIIAGAIFYAVSEYTKDPHKGQVQENIAWVLFGAGVVAFIVGPRIGGSGD